jgi:MYXO-CTERM domain-containing protein
MQVRCLAGALALGLGVCAPAFAQSDVYAIDLRATPNRLLRFPVNAPANNAISTNASYDGFALDFDSSANTLYGITNPTNQFGTIDLGTGNFTAIAPVSGAGSAETNWAGMSMDPTTNTMYGLAGSNLYTINLATGATSLVAPITGPTGALYIDLAIDSNGNAYLHDIAADTLLSLNTATGAATLIGPTGLAANFAQGMDFDWATNTLYATIYTGGGTGAFCSMNLATGAANIITSTTTWNSEMEMAVRSAIPAPGSLGLLALAGLAGLRRRR